MKRRALFLDKDGTLVRNVAHNVDSSKVEFLPGVIDGLMKALNTGYSLFIVTNQAGIAQGRFTEAKFQMHIQNLRRLLATQGCLIRDIYHCPHDPKGSVPELSVACSCRKPKDGMLRRAAKEHDIDLSDSWMIGDILDDIEAGHRAGCRTVLVDNGNEDQWVLSPDRRPDMIVTRFEDAVNFVRDETHKKESCVIVE